jgi:L-threonylcarbamoyladenylate synthase
VQIDPAAIDEATLERAVECLLAERLLAFPTETVYGLGALADNERAASKIFVAKGRPPHNPLITHLASIDQARALCGNSWSGVAEELAQQFWPGPLTLVLPKAECIAPIVCAHGPSMALRVPAHPIAAALLRAVGRPIAAPSANRSNQLSPTTAAHVLATLDGRIDMVIDGGPCAVGLESTVLDLTVDPPVILRPGSITSAMLRPLVPLVRPYAYQSLQDGQARPSPGMERLHYAPNAKLILASRAELAEACRAASLTNTNRVGVMTVGVAPSDLRADIVVALQEDPAAYGAALFATLHMLDSHRCTTVVVEQLPEHEAWDAARDRLNRAASA